MNWQTIATNVGLPLVGVGGVGGVGAAISWFVKSLVKQEFQQQLERHKTKLRNSEFLFQKEFEAASAFISLKLNLMNNILGRADPDMDNFNFLRNFLYSFQEAEKLLEDYIAIHSAALQKDTLKYLYETISIISETLPKVTKIYQQPGQLDDNVRKRFLNNRNKLVSAIHKIQEELYQSVRSQSD